MPNDALSPPPGAAVEDMLQNVRDASNFLKALAHEGRLAILCYLVEGERTVGELEQLLSARQPAVSQQLARLRLDGLVATRREGKAIYYRLGDARVERLIGTLHAIFCADPASARGPAA
jgi:DNA-binding transcriptional ArsR family regulator